MFIYISLIRQPLRIDFKKGKADAALNANKNFGFRILNKSNRCY